MVMAILFLGAVFLYHIIEDNTFQMASLSLELYIKVKHIFIAFVADFTLIDLYRKNPSTLKDVFLPFIPHFAQFLGKKELFRPLSVPTWK